MTLDTRAGLIVSGLSGPAADATIGQLLSHTSGLVGDAGPDHRALSRADAITAISRLPQAFTPGTDFAYTNAGYTLLALVIDTITGDYRSTLDTIAHAGNGRPASTRQASRRPARAQSPRHPAIRRYGR